MSFWCIRIIHVKQFFIYGILYKQNERLVLISYVLEKRCHMDVDLVGKKYHSP